jgi:hypothetical protein
MVPPVIIPAILIMAIFDVVAENALFVFFGVVVADALAFGITLIVFAVVPAIIFIPTIVFVVLTPIGYGQKGVVRAASV